LWHDCTGKVRHYKYWKSSEKKQMACRRGEWAISKDTEDSGGPKGCVPPCHLFLNPANVFGQVPTCICFSAATGSYRQLAGPQLYTVGPRPFLGLKHTEKFAFCRRHKSYHSVELIKNLCVRAVVDNFSIANIVSCS